MFWQALSAISELGLFILGLYSLFRPILSPFIKILIIIALIFYLFLIFYHKLFRLIRKNQGPAVYKVTWGIKCWIKNPYTFKKMGYTADDIESVSEFEFNLHPAGKCINLKRH